ncbi:hypothetical protein Tco_0711112, partial [Tanacetum coccineum]
IIPQNSAFQTEDLGAYDSDCDDLSLAKAVLMANLSSCDPEVLSKVLYSDSYPNDMINQDVQEMQYSEQTHIDDFQENEIHSNSNTIIVIAKEHDVISVTDDEETLILEEESQSKMLDKQNDPISIEKKIKISPIDCSKLNKIKEDFVKRFVTQKELFAEQAFLLKHSSFSETPITSHTPVRIEAPSELLKLSIDNDQLLKEIMSHEIVHIVVNFVDILDVQKSCCGNMKKVVDEIETINIELEHSVAKLLSKNENLRKEREHLKSIYKDQFDSIRKTRVQSKEHSDSSIAQINAKSVENSDLNAQIQEKVFAIVALKNELRKLKGKNVATIAPGMFKLDIQPISHRLKNNRDAHEVYLEKTIEITNILRGLIECTRTSL